MKHTKRQSRKSARSRKNAWVWILLGVMFVFVTVGAGVLASTGILDEYIPSSGILPFSRPSGSSVPSEGPSQVSGPDSSAQPDSSSVPLSSDDSPSQLPLPGGEDDEPSRIPVINLSTPVRYNGPDTMQGAMVTAGADFLRDEDKALSEEEVRAQISQLVQRAAELNMNSLIIDPVAEGGTEFVFSQESAQEGERAFDPFSVLISSARAAGLYVYGVYDLRVAAGLAEDGTPPVLDSDRVGLLSNALSGFVSQYDLDGAILQGYTTEKSPATYEAYLREGGGMGFERYLYESSAQFLNMAVRTLRREAPQTQVGLWVEPFSPDPEEGDLWLLQDCYADLQPMIEEGLFDFIAVQNYRSAPASQEGTDAVDTPQEDGGEGDLASVSHWWSSVAESAGIPCYILHDNAGSDSQKLAQEAMEAAEFPGYGGSIYNSLSALSQEAQGGQGEPGETPGSAQQPGNSTLTDYIAGSTQNEHISQKLVVTKPAESTFSTYEPSVVFAGAASPSEPVYINDQTVETDQNGYFSVTLNLNIGVNAFEISQGDQSFPFTITRQIRILEGYVSPSGSITVDGSMQVTISVSAYEEAQVYAVIGGQTVPMSIQQSDDDATDRDSSYALFSGIFNVPAATSSAQSLGAITVYASWEGMQENLTGASITVNKKKTLQSGVLAQVITDHAETYPDSVLNILSQPGYYELPKGTMDYIVGDEVVYKSDGKTYSFFNMASGLRIAKEDLSTVSTIDSIEGNVISGMTVSGDDRYTTIRLSTQYKVPFSVKYDQNTVKMTFHYTDSTPGGLELPDSRLFSAAAWSGNVLNLTLNTAGGFMGFTSWYEGDVLVLRFNNPGMMQSSGTLSGTKIVIDPGHSVADPGASGFLAKYPEQVINYGIARQLKAILQDWGATVMMIDTQSSAISLESRVAQSISYEPHLFVSIHNNSSPNPAGKGTEVYYFNDFSNLLASRISANAASYLDTVNRGGKFGRYYVTRVNQFPAVLVECGFVTNQAEYEKLIQKSVQYSVAMGVAVGIQSYMKTTGALNWGNDFTLKTGSMDAAEENDPPVSAADPSIIVEDVNLEEDKLTLEVGQSERLTMLVTPEEATGNEKVKWESFDTSVVTVNQSGVITAVAPGTARVRVITTDGKYGDNCVVTVVKATSREVDQITLDKEDVTLQVGELFTLSAETYPEEDAPVEWESSDPAVAVVRNGKVTAKGAGTAIVTASVNGGEVTAECIVRVRSNEEVQITLDTEWIQLEPGEEFDLEVEITPSTHQAELSWSSSDREVATVEDGHVVALKEGEATITVRIKGSMRQVASCDVTVMAPE